MKRLAWILLLCLCSAVPSRSQAPPQAGPWRQALPGWDYTFPQDHYAHPDFRTEWWYLTGNLQAADGRSFGYQFTIFRRGIRPPADRAPVQSRFVKDDVLLGHFTLTDVSGKKFHHVQRLSRGAFGEAGCGLAGTPRLAWIEGSVLTLADDGHMTLVSKVAENVSLELHLVPSRPIVIHGENGLSQKSAGAGNASHYYSISRMKSSGRLTIGGETLSVTGTSWLDREWATNQLAADQVGWDWFSLRLSDGSDLMIYQLRRRDGSADPYSSGTLITPDGKTQHLHQKDFTLTPSAPWLSPGTGGRYPLSWKIEVPARRLSLTVTPLLPDQELVLQPVSYWEGAVHAEGTQLTAEGYMELTGYAGALTPLHGAP